jgi:uroporphyrinogen-III synthase
MGLNGARIGLLESRMSGELATLIRNNGGDPRSAPSVREVALNPQGEVSAFIDRLAAGSYAFVLFMTGVGVKALFQEAEGLGRLEELLNSLRKTTTVCRGPKPIAVLKRYDVPISIAAPEPNTTAELIEALKGVELTNKRAAMLHYGERAEEMAGYLKSRGAQLDELCLYEWQLPEDTSPLKDLIGEVIRGELDSVAFTSKVQVRHLFQVADEIGKADELKAALNTRTVVTAIGPTCATELIQRGVPPRVVPEHPKMGYMVKAMSDYFSARPLPAAES